MYQRVEKAKELFLSGFNCSQSVFGAFNDIFGISDDVALKISSGLGGGIGRLRNVCGAVSGGALVIGLVYGATEGSDSEAKAETYKVVRELAEKVAEMKGSYICKELLNRFESESYVPDERTDKYYQERPCTGMVMLCAEIVCDILVEAGYDVSMPSD